MPFDAQPILKGDLVELDPLRAEDYDDLYAVAADPLIWAQHPDKSRHEEDGFRTFFREAIASGGTLVARDAGNRLVIGSSRFHGYDEARSEVEIGWTFLVRSRWGGAHNAEMKHLMLTHAFRFVERVAFLVDPGNRRSQRAVEKIGGAREGTRQDSRGTESFLYRITASQCARPERPRRAWPPGD